MTRLRLAGAAAAVLTALLLQATLVAPITAPVPVSLPAVLVAAVAMVDGPGAGLAFGFAAGLVADLGSAHPAGVLALVWMGVGVLCGLSADRRSVRRDALTAAVVCGVASAVVAVLLAVVHGAAPSADALRWLLPAAGGDLVLAVLLVPLTRRMLRTETLRAPRTMGAQVVVRG